MSFVHEIGALRHLALRAPIAADVAGASMPRRARSHRNEEIRRAEDRCVVRVH